MADEKELWSKFSKVFDETKKRKITDFDSGLLQDQFESLSGGPREEHREMRGKLRRVAARLAKENNEGKYDAILQKIDSYFGTKIDKFRPNVDDFSQDKGRIIKIIRGDDSGNEASCTPEIYKETLDAIREEQYHELNNQIEMLLYQATALLEDSVFAWHNDLRQEIVEITPGDENNGKRRTELQ